MAKFFYVFLLLSLLAHNASSMSPCPAKDALESHQKFLDKKCEEEIIRIRNHYALEQKKFESEVQELEAIIMAPGAVCPPHKRDFERVYFHQEPIIFHLAKNDSLHSLLRAVLDQGANPSQKHPFYTDPRHAATPLSVAREAKAGQNEQLLLRYIHMKQR